MYIGQDFSPTNPAENEIYSFDFVNDLGTGESITSVASVALTVFQGTDGNPSSHLSGGASVSGTVVSQRLANLVSGVTYTFSITVNTSLSNVLELFSRVACLPVT